MGRSVGMCGDERWSGGRVSSAAPATTKDTSTHETFDQSKQKINVTMNYFDGPRILEVSLMVRKDTKSDIDQITDVSL